MNIFKGFLSFLICFIWFALIESSSNITWSRPHYSDFDDKAVGWCSLSNSSQGMAFLKRPRHVSRARSPRHCVLPLGTWPVARAVASSSFHWNCSCENGAWQYLGSLIHAMWAKIKALKFHRYNTIYKSSPSPWSLEAGHVFLQLLLQVPYKHTDIGQK